MKRIVSILMMMVAMMTITASAFAQTPNQKQRISREQLAEKQAQHIAHDLAFDEKTTARFIETYTTLFRSYEDSPHVHPADAGDLC